MVLYGNGELYAWGCGIFGQLGNGNTSNLLAPAKVYPQNEKTCRFAYVDCGKRHSMAVDC